MKTRSTVLLLSMSVTVCGIAFGQSQQRNQNQDQDTWAEYMEDWAAYGDSDDWAAYGDADDWNMYLDVDEDENAWVRIAYDYDNDGKYDTYGYVYAMDLQELMRTGGMQQDRDRNQRQREMRGERGERERRMRDRQMRDRQRQMRDSRSRQQMQRERNRNYRVQGEITNLKTIRLSGVKSAHLVGKIDTRRGSDVKVDFGPKQRIQRQFDLSEGDRVQIVGKRGRINDREMLMADRIRANGDTFRVKRQRGEGYRQLEGRVVSTKRARLRGDNNQHVIAKVRTNEGRQFRVALGTVDQLGQLNLQQGDRVKFLAKECRINDRPGLLAKRIRHDGETFVVNEQMRDRGDRRSMRDSRRGDQGQTRNMRDSRKQDQVRRYSGEIVRSQSMQLRGDGNRKHMVAHVRLNNGNVKKVALGTKQRMNQIGVEKGDRVTFYAKQCKIDGKPGLVATRVRFDDDMHRVNRQMRNSSERSTR